MKGRDTMKERKGCVFSISQDNEPVAGCTISKDVVHQADCQVLYFSLAAQTDISPSMVRKENGKFRRVRFTSPGPVSLSA